MTQCLSNWVLAMWPNVKKQTGKCEQQVTSVQGCHVCDARQTEALSRWPCFPC